MADQPPSGEPGRREVGVVGLGTMGGQIAGHLLAAGYPVVGADVVPDRGIELAAIGGTVAVSAAEIAARADAVILSLPTVKAFEDVIRGPGGIAEAARPGLAVIEASTLPLDVKEDARLLLRQHGAELLDCPISGTGAQMAAKDVVVYASGDPAAIEQVAPVLDAFTRDWVDMGAFGNGTRLKLVANLLVAVHNVATAEALLIAERAGIDPRAALTALAAGAGTSRMLEVRGPLMLDDGWGKATMRVRTFQKDLDIISGFARSLNCPTPLFGTAAQVHLAALAQGHGDDDTASVFAVLRLLAGGTGGSRDAAPAAPVTDPAPVTAGGQAGGSD